jgi:16S rRNA G1207 methylase RsmC
LRISFRTFESALDLGCGRGLTASELTKDVVKCLTMVDSSSLMLNQTRPPVEENGHNLPGVFRKVLYLLKNDAPFIGKYIRILTLIECMLYVFRCNVCLRYFI